ncbi:hypothetical protein AVEN_265756-1 [Araneus ventricosus]|uniref:Uncharacterized protein n=1 Tax=Araneus ventricosus TaxID=182803 RepID=A0A4Y2QVL9_ARAVE|nr:hypothetical protein AVEN_265756-1 [Araneus ventricosus]
MSATKTASSPNPLKSSFRRICPSSSHQLSGFLKARISSSLIRSLLEDMTCHKPHPDTGSQRSFSSCVRKVIFPHILREKPEAMPNIFIRQ